MCRRRKKGVLKGTSEPRTMYGRGYLFGRSHHRCLIVMMARSPAFSARTAVESPRHLNSTSRCVPLRLAG